MKRKEVKSKDIPSTPQELMEKSKIPSSSLLSRKNLIIIAVLILALLFWKFKGYFIAATVNGQPISRWQLNNQLQKRFGDQVLENIINERLILAATRQKGIFVTSLEIEGRVKQIEERLKGQMDIEQALKAQGLTREDFRRQIEIQLSIDKTFDKEATISSTEIDDYIKKNSQLYKEATDQGAVKEEVKAFIRQQKVNDLFEKWFEDIRKNAKITKFL